MDYKLLYHEMNRRRKIEIDLCHKTITEASKLYDNIITVCNKYQNKDKQVVQTRRLCSDTCSSLESTYQALLETDTIIEEMCMDEDIRTTTIYSFDSLKDNAIDD